MSFVGIKELFRKVEDSFSKDKFELVIAFQYGYFMSILYVLNRPNIDFKNEFEDIKSVCEKYDLDYEGISNFEMGKNVDGGDYLSFYPSGVIELCVLQNTNRQIGAEEFNFVVLGKALGYLILAKISTEEYLFLLDRFRKDFLLAHQGFLENLYKEYVPEGELLKFVIGMLSHTQKVDRAITDQLISFPENPPVMED